MAQFMLFLWNDRTVPVDMSSAEMQAFVQEYFAWTDKLRAEGRLVGAQRLSDIRTDPGRKLSGVGKDLAVTDRMLPETKEVVGGFYQIHAKDYDEAVEIARTCPHLRGRNARIEIREVRLER
jgi:hypothetical protein